MTETPLAVVILAAGQSTRMKSVTAKVLHNLAGRSLLGHVLAAVAPLEPERTIIVTSPDARDIIAAAFPDATTVVQAPARGTAHAVLAARQALQEFAGDVLVLYGDTPLMRSDTLRAMLRARAGGAAVVVAGFRPSDTTGYGRLLLADDGTLERIVEARDADPDELAVRLCNAGFMAFDGGLMFTLLEQIGNDNAKGEFYLTSVVALARAAGEICQAVECSAEEAAGVDSRHGLAASEAAMQGRLRRRALDAGATLLDPASTWFSFDTELALDVVVEPSVFFGPGVWIGEAVRVKAFSHLEGCRIAAGAVIGPFARIRPGSDIAVDARIGNFVEVKNARIEAGAKANHLSYLGDARIGAGANIGAGTITCNYDGFVKSHTDIGINAFIGSNSALVAPVKIGDGAIVGAGSTISRDVAPNSIVVERGEQNQRQGMAHAYRERRRKAKREQAGE